MKKSATGLSRRQAVTRSGLAAASLLGLGNTSANAYAEAGLKRDDITRAVTETLFADTHEHLVEEHSRTDWSQPVPLLPCDDWALLFSHYLNSDLVVAGMPANDYSRFVSPTETTDAKWRLLEPHWKHVLHTGYARAVRITLQQLHDIPDLNARSVHRLAERHAALVRPGFYKTVLHDHAGVETCQVNSLQAPFMESRQPDLLLQDLSIVAFGGFSGGNWSWMTDATGAKASDLAGWHRVIDHYFTKYGPYAVAVKSQTAYQRRLDFANVTPEQAAPIFTKLLARDPVSPEDRKTFDDHIFWYCTRKATALNLPVKLHTGYYAGHGGMPLDRVSANPADVSDLLRRAPETTFVLMHIGYPYQEAMLALAKHFPNAVIDLCWTWIINPEASARYLRDHLVTAPANKILTFGGDYIPVEPVVGHAAIARRGIARTLQSLAADGWMSRSEAVDLVEPLMRGTARRLFRIEEKLKNLALAPWRQVPPASTR
jgi:predicted TIM-barrel fold metal-dependent hydrolase